jgi:hypothetical protein
MYIRLIQAVFISMAFVGWVVYQLAIRKKRFSEISNDVLAIVFFVAVWFGLVTGCLISFLQKLHFFPSISIFEPETRN